MALNVQEMAQSAFNIINQIQNSALQMVGLDVLWCRATPEPNSEDVILQEYTLTNIGLECPQPIKVLTTNSDYNPGNFTVDLFGVNYDAPLEVNVTISEWQAIFGADTMPQNGDVVYVKILHKLFEVKSSQIMYTIASMPTYFKCQLSKYNPTASRRETDEFRQSIDELTVSQEELFGDAISQEVADTVIEVETGYNTTSYVDPLKDFDMQSVIFEPLIGPSGNHISNAYYDFTKADRNITYNIAAHYSTESERQHWIYTCWFRINQSDAQKDFPIKILDFVSKDKQYWYFKISTVLKLNYGDIVTLTRGSLLSIPGEIIQLGDCESVLGLRIKLGDANRASRKLSQWHVKAAQRFRISKASTVNMLASDNDSIRIDFKPDNSQFDIVFGQWKKTVIAQKKITDLSSWMYLAIDFSSDNMEIVLFQLQIDGNATMFMNELIHDNIKQYGSSGDFEFETLAINAAGSALNIRNIRLYENEYEMGETYKTDMFSEVTRNASKLILVDAPNVREPQPFETPVR